MNRSRRKPRFSLSPVFLLFVFGLFLAVFWNVLFGDQQFVYRDESHFYYPVFQYIQAELNMGRFPLWTPYDNLGQPFFANAALAILYPGKLIFFLPLDYTILYNVYITAHVLIAALTLYRLARRWGVGPWGATLGGLSYGFAGTVLGQYCNPIFLVGAAWVPEAVLQGDLMLTRRSLRRAFLCAAVLSIMLLGGDPQAAFQVGMILSLLALFRWIRERDLKKRSEAIPGPCLRRPAFSQLLRNRAVLLGIVAGTTFLFSAVQVLPSQEYSRLCDRAGFKNPRSIWEIPRFLLAEEKDLAKHEILFDDSAVKTRRSADVVQLTRWQRSVYGILHEGRIDPHQAASYNFSEHPIQFLDYLWPQFEGLPFPQNSTWFGCVVQNKVPGNWFSTVYMGVVPLLLALVSLRFRLTRRDMRLSPKSDRAGQHKPKTDLTDIPGSPGRQSLGQTDRKHSSESPNVRVVWLSWVLLLCLWSSTGIYGLGWFLQSLGLSEFVPPAVGGGYWFLQTFVPGYIQFRYPAKLLTLAAMPIAMLGAYGFERLVTILRTSTNESDPMPLPDSSIRWFGRLSLAVIVVSVIFFIPSSMPEQWYALAHRAGSSDLSGPFVPRLARSFVLFSLAQVILVLGAVLFLVRCRGRYSGRVLISAILLIVSVDLYLSAKSIIFVEDRDYYARDASVVWKHVRDDSKPEPVRIILNLKDLVRWRQESSPDRLVDFLLRNRKQVESQFHYALPRNAAGNLLLAKAEEWGTMMPYSYLQWLRRNIRNDYRYETNIMSLGVEYVIMDVSKPLAAEYASIVMQGGTPETPPDWPENAVLWKMKAPKNRVWIERDGTPSNESARIVRYEPSSVVVEAELNGPGTLVLSDQYWPGWHVTVETLDKPGGNTVSKSTETIRSIIELFRGVDLPAGAHRLTFHYSPDSFRNGAVISAVSWTLFAIFLFLGRIRIWRGVFSCENQRPAGAI